MAVSKHRCEANKLQGTLTTEEWKAEQYMICVSLDSKIIPVNFSARTSQATCFGLDRNLTCL